MNVNVFPHLGIVVLMLLCTPVQSRSQALFENFEAFKDSLTALTQLSDVSEREAGLSAFWDTLSANNQIPYKQGDRVAFLYRGTGTSIDFPGDHNRWTPGDGSATKLGDSDVWIREEGFPQDARIDYKIVRNGSEWILDPANPLLQRGGFGDNSELRMPDYVPSPWVDPRDGVASGDYTVNQSIASTNLGYSVNYRVYTPPGYHPNRLSNLPAIYVTDGHEYADDLMGSMRIVMDNLIADARIEPMIAVFIDPRVGGENLRGQQFLENPSYAAFVAEELVPEIDATYRTNPDRMARGILGTSFGGVNSAYFGAQVTDTFYFLGIQSPAFHAGPSIFSLYNDQPARNLRIHLSWGTINDVGSAGVDFATILADKGYEFRTVEMNEGHSWGLWRALIDDVLIYFKGIPSTSVDQHDIPDTFSLGQNYPNPFNRVTSIPFSLSQAGAVKLTVYDTLGRSVAVLVDAVKETGSHTVQWNAQDVPSGVYYGRLVVEGGETEMRMLLKVR